MASDAAAGVAVICRRTRKFAESRTFSLNKSCVQDIRATLFTGASEAKCLVPRGRGHVTLIAAAGFVTPYATACSEASCTQHAALRLVHYACLYVLCMAGARRLAQHMPLCPCPPVPPAAPPIITAGAAGQKLGAKLSDYELLSLLMLATGYDAMGGCLPQGICMSHSSDGWDRVNIR